MNFKNKTELLPVIIQDNISLEVLMLGYMNEEAYLKTQEIGKVTFFSRSKNRLWTKGESSGNFLFPKKYFWDCDKDTLLIIAERTGPVCHTGSINCFNSSENKNFIYELEEIIKGRLKSGDETSYVKTLSKKGIHKVAQKVGEEAVELIIEAMQDNKEDFKNEAADLLFHFLMLCANKNIDLKEIEEVLSKRHTNALS